MGWAMALLPTRARWVTRVNLALCSSELDARERARLARRSLIETGKAMAETGALWLRSRERILGWMRGTVGEEHLRAALATGRGIIFAAPHLGAWEMVGLYLSHHYPMTSLYRPPRLAGMEALSRQGRQRLGAHLVPTDVSGVRALYRALERGEMVGILPDQEPGVGAGVYAPFFGVPAWTMVLLPRLLQRSGAPVVFVWAQRLSWGRGYVLHFSPPPMALAGPQEAAARALNAGVEQCVRACAQQYMWSYKRFRTRPAGEPSLYRRG